MPIAVDESPLTTSLLLPGSGNRIPTMPTSGSPKSLDPETIYNDNIARPLLAGICRLCRLDSNGPRGVHCGHAVRNRRSVWVNRWARCISDASLAAIPDSDATIGFRSVTQALSTDVGRECQGRFRGHRLLSSATEPATNVSQTENRLSMVGSLAPSPEARLRAAEPATWVSQAQKSPLPKRARILQDAVVAVIRWWLRVGSNHRPRHYECRALTS